MLALKNRFLTCSLKHLCQRWCVVLQGEISLTLGRGRKKPALGTWCAAEVWCSCLSQRERKRRPERVALEEVGRTMSAR